MMRKKAGPIGRILVGLASILAVACWLLIPQATPQEARLLEAAKQGDTVMIAELLKSGTPVNARQKGPVWQRLAKGRPDVMDDYTPLMLAALYDRKDAATLLLQNGADINAHSVTGNTALMAAANMGNVEIVTLLIHSGADVSVKNKYGATAVNFATKRNAKPKFDAIIHQLEAAQKRGSPK